VRGPECVLAPGNDVFEATGKRIGLCIAAQFQYVGASAGVFRFLAQTHCHVLTVGLVRQHRPELSVSSQRIVYVWSESALAGMQHENPLLDKFRIAQQFDSEAMRRHWGLIHTPRFAPLGLRRPRPQRLGETNRGRDFPIHRPLSQSQ